MSFQVLLHAHYYGLCLVIRDQLSSSSKCIIGTIPSTWGSSEASPQLLILEISDSLLSGTLPASWPSSLQSLHLSYNRLNGTLPAQYGTMLHLKSLELLENLLNGPLPAEWGYPSTFPQLFDLELSINNLTGFLPSSWGSQAAFQNLKLLFMDVNNITGTLPESWASDGAFPELQGLSMRNGALQGTIPASWTASSAFLDLQLLDLGYNFLQGPLPGFDNPNLLVIELDGCPLNSTVAALWNSTAPLQLISVANASLFGSLPDLPKALKGTRVLDLGSNHLTGTLPLSWLAVGGLLSHVSDLNVGQLWTRSTDTTDWRQQLCLQKSLYDNDTTGQQLSLLPGFRQNLSDIEDNRQADQSYNDATSSWEAFLESGSFISLAGESLALSDGSANQLVSVRDICSNHNSHVVLLVVWLVFGVCCLLVLAVYMCVLVYTSRRGPIKLGPKSRLLSVQAAAASLYDAFAGLSGLAFYYYDLITSIIVLRQVWGLWPGDILLTIFMFHFTTTGAVVAFHALYRLVQLWYDASQTNCCFHGCILALAVVSSPLMIPVVLLLDTFAFVAQIFKAVKFIVRLPGMHWLDQGYVAVFRLHHFVRPRKFLGLGWVDLESYDHMHNFVAAVFQSLPTVILYSVPFSTGNKPTHGIFLSTGLFVTAVVASCLAMLRVLIVTLWQSFRANISVFQHVAILIAGKTLSKQEEVKSSAQLSHVDLLVQKYLMSGSAPLGDTGHTLST